MNGLWRKYSDGSTSERFISWEFKEIPRNVTHKEPNKQVRYAGLGPGGMRLVVLELSALLEPQRGRGRAWFFTTETVNGTS